MKTETRRSRIGESVCTSHLLTTDYKKALLQMACLGFEPDDTSAWPRSDKSKAQAPPFPDVKRAVRVLKRSGLHGTGKASSASRRIYTCLVVGDATAQGRLADVLANAKGGPVLPLEDGGFAVVGPDSCAEMRRLKQISPGSTDAMASVLAPGDR